MKLSASSRIAALETTASVKCASQLGTWYRRDVILALMTAPRLAWRLLPHGPQEPSLMSHFASLTRLAAGSFVLVALGSACGGKSIEPGDDDNGGSSAVAGQPPAGGVGSVGNGGTGNAAGATSTGGTSLIGGTTSVGGSGSYAGEACTAPADPGPCNAYGPSWYHDSNTGVCRPFVYGGCGGNANRYASLGACQMSCRGGDPNFDGCTRATDCTLTGNGCCGTCDTPSLTKHDFISFNKKYQGLQCVGIPLELPAPDAPAGAPIACPGCPEIAGGTLKNFLPNCVQNECVVVDLRDLEFTACTVDTDCTYRFGTGCCQSCDEGDAIPLRKDAQLEPIFCAEGPVACAPCPPPSPHRTPYPKCGAEGRCELVYIAF